MGIVKCNENIIKDISIVIQSIDDVLVNLNRYFEINDAFKDKNDIIKKAPILFTQAFDNLKYKIIVLAMKLFEETNEQIGLERIINELKTFKEYHVSLKNLINKSRKMLKKVLPKGYLSKTKLDKKEDEENNQPNEQPDKTNCWDNVEHAINGIDHGTYCEITECDKGWYPHEMHECKQEPTETECKGRIKNSTEVKVQYNSYGIPDCYVHKCGRGYKPSSDYKACERDDKYANVPKEFCEETLKGTYTEDGFCKCGTVYFETNQTFKTCKLEDGSDYEYTIQ